MSNYRIWTDGTKITPKRLVDAFDEGRIVECRVYTTKSTGKIYARCFFGYCASHGCKKVINLTSPPRRFVDPNMCSKHTGRISAAAAKSLIAKKAPLARDASQYRIWQNKVIIKSKHIIDAFDAGKIVARQEFSPGQFRWKGRCTYLHCQNLYTIGPRLKPGSVKERCRMHSRAFLVEGVCTNSVWLTGIKSKITWLKNARGSLIPYVRCSMQTCHKQVRLKKGTSYPLCGTHASSQRLRPFESVYNAWKADTEKRNRKRVTKIDFKITFDQFVAFVETNKICHYCNTTLRRCAYRGRKKDKRDQVSVYVDRVNPFAGYTLDNMVACCTSCNMAKNIYISPEEMKVLGLLRQGNCEAAVRAIKENAKMYTAWQEAIASLSVASLRTLDGRSEALQSADKYYQKRQQCEKGI